MSYIDKFGGSAIEPSQVAFRAVALSASITTMWPTFATSNNSLARIMKVSASAPGFTISLPDATLNGAGQDVIFDNSGLDTFSVLDFAGNSIATLTAGQVKYLYLSDSSTSAGTWRVTLFGAGSSTLDASQLAGSGITAIGATLNQAYPATTITTNTTFTTSDRAKLYVNTGGSITGTLPLTSTVGNNWFMELRNQGTGTMTIAGSGGDTVDSSATIVLQLNESCTLIAGSGAWYSVGRGRNQQFNFTQLSKAVTGGTTTLTLTEASNVVQTYTGVLLSAEVLVLPAVVQVYYIANNTTGAYTFTVQSPTPGSTLVIPTGQSAVVFCDGTNVINASTSVSGITSLLLSAGAAASPSLALVNANNGFFAPTGTSVAVSAGGTETTRWAAGQQLSANGAVGAPTYSFTLSATTGLYSPAVNQIGVSVNGASVGVFSSSGYSGLVTGGASGAIAATTLSASAATSLANLGVTGDITFSTGATRTIAVGSSGIGVRGYDLRITAGTGNTANGGDVTVYGGATITSGAFGNVVLSYIGGAAQGYTLIGSATASGTAILQVTGNATKNTLEIGYLEIPQNSQSTAYTCVLADSGKHIYHPSADTTARTYTIPANASVAYPIGTALTFINDTSGGVITIAITSDVMILAGAGTTGSRTLAANGIATAVKMTATRWIISGSGLT